ncbi:MAG TPA: hypothetical protein PKD57_12720 [Saprospiraceae bacterium]|nr:hypothetical protein [Saprospiraceae bacterium]
MTTPSFLEYGKVKPTGFPSKTKRGLFYPQTQYTDIKGNDIVRFNINAPGFWDPYSCRVVMKVSFDNMETEGSLQLDGSGQSLINECIISVGLNEVERIQEYDVLASILNDMSFSPQQRSQQRHQGLSSEIFPNSSIHEDLVPIPKYSFLTKANVTVNAAAMDIYTSLCGNTRLLGYQPTVRLQGTSIFQNSDITAYTTNSVINGGDSLIHGKFVCPSDISASGRAIMKNDVNNLLSRADVGFFYSKDINTLEKYNGTPASYPTGSSAPHIKEEWSIQGMRKPFKGSFSVGTFEDQFSKAVSNRVMHRGDVCDTTYRQPLYAEYSVPLLSGFIGGLIPKDKYKLIPAFTFQPLQIEFRINPFAFFTSGYIGTEDTLSTAKIAHPAFRALTTGKQMDRTAWRIVEMSIEVDLLQFDDTITDAVMAQINSGEGIIFPSVSYTLGPLWTLSNTLACGGTFQVNIGLESLKAILLCYISNDYLTYSFCRKLYKLSSNITWLQAKFGIDYVPDKPIEGHGGNPDLYSLTDVNNEIYLRELYRSFNIVNVQQPDCVVNKFNFAINQRPYDVTKTTAYLVDGAANGELNVDTAYGWPLIHENRCVGRGVYCLDLTNNSLRKSDQLVGINTVEYRPFDLVVKTDGINLNPTYDRARTMYVFCHYDFLVQISKSGVRVLGRG